MSRRCSSIVAGSLAVALLAGLAFLAGEYEQSRQGIPTVEVPATPVVDPAADAQFRAQVAPMEDMNSGLTLQRSPIGIFQGAPTPSPNYIDLVIFNHTDEPVQFSDIGFHIQAFSYKPSTQRWIPISFTVFPAPTPQVLPARLETLDFNVLNSVVVMPKDLPPTAPRAMRLLVSGLGTKTGKTYGAFLDVMLVP